MNKDLILGIGEYLVDIIGTGQSSKGLEDTETFVRKAGGSPANFIRNLKGLGAKAELIATVGTDSLGDFLIKEAKNAGFSGETLSQNPDYPTTSILVAGSSSTPDFIPYRGADLCIEKEQIPDYLVDSIAILHTTAFALSKEPARNTILAISDIVRGNGGLVSVDFNYAPEIWPDRYEAVRLFFDYCQGPCLVKLSEDDFERAFAPFMTLEEFLHRFHENEEALLCFTQGKEGGFVCKGSVENKTEFTPLPVEEVVDTTGAGDAFWSGFVYAFSKEKSIADCIEKGRETVARKLTKVGPLSPQDLASLSYN